MNCRFCKAENPEGRENCLRCGRALLDIHGVMHRDRWVGKALRFCLYGIVLGIVLGAAVGILIERSTGEFSAIFDAAWAGAWAGGVVIGFLAFAFGVLYHRLLR